jgi:hypothetical protein
MIIPIAGSAGLAIPKGCQVLLFLPRFACSCFFTSNPAGVNVSPYAVDQQYPDGSLRYMNAIANQDGLIPKSRRHIPLKGIKKNL